MAAAARLNWSQAFNAERADAIEKAMLNSIGGLLQLVRSIIDDDATSEQIDQMMGDLRTLVAIKGVSAIAQRVAQRVVGIPDAARMTEDMALFSMAVQRGGFMLAATLGQDSAGIQEAFVDRWRSLQASTISSVFQTFRNLYRLSAAITRKTPGKIKQI